VRPRHPALACFAARQVLAAPGQFFALPAPVPALFRPLRRKGLSAVSSTDPVQGAVGGDQLAQPPCAGDFFPLATPAVGSPLRRPLALLPLERALLLAHPYPARALPGRQEGPVAPVTQLQVLRRGLPARAPERARCALLRVERRDKPLVPRRIFSLALPVRGTDPRSTRRAVLRLAAAVPAADAPPPAPSSLFVATVLGAPQLPAPGVAFVRAAVVHQQKGVLALLKPVFAHPPHLPGHQPRLSQQVIAYGGAHVLHGLGQRGTGAVLGGAQPIRHILFLCQPGRSMLFSAFKRKSWIHLLIG